MHLVATFACAVLLIGGVLPVCAEKRLALVIGNDRYVNLPILLKAEGGMAAKARPRDPIDYHLQISFKTEVRQFDFPYGIIISQTGSRDGRRGYYRSRSYPAESYPADLRNRHGCYSPADLCPPWSKRHAPRHRRHPRTN